MARLKELRRSLTFRIAGLLALALLPVGLISVVTTYQLLNKADRELRDGLLALTSEAAAEQEAAVRSATGVAKAFVGMIPVLRSTGFECEEPLQNILRDSPELSFLGYVANDGTLLCASADQGSDLSDRPLHKEFVENPGPRVKFNAMGAISKTAVVIVSLPVISDGAYDGYVTASLPHRQLNRPTPGTVGRERPLELITFNAEGEVLTSTANGDREERFLPSNRSLSALVSGEEATFVARVASGEERLFALSPIVPGQVFALGSWEYRRGPMFGGLGIGSSLLFPLLMWVVSLLVAFFAVQRMVIKPTRNLRARMLQFMRSRRLVEPNNDPSIPTEIRDMEETWMRLAENILHDEAELYDTIHQRTVLLKEVHHRVKNNLQLIVSLVGMKMRKAKSPAVKLALSNVQQRVMSIARVHQNLYETSTAERVRAGELLDAITGQIVAAASQGEEELDLETRFDDCEVYPDQAVPLSLAVSELITNALKHIGPLEGEKKARLEVSLNCEEGSGHGQVKVCNTLPPEPVPQVEDSTGLGEQLVRAFSSQMEAAVHREETDTHYTVIIDFPIQGFDDNIVPSDHVIPVSSGTPRRDRALSS
ncbi:sensor histidine kinase [Maritimibacter dapengensis]|uniref:histidine kinase n=1 Tax=Maritimibacter dapengensis TaxID=2836868 RepID=A0ABS6T788_9RHOB|nr:sensor histidine kinase [Maritimibacter dapengensis]MBV7380341.1 sensor histidine kinase [Maritimibacter dapengensis]